MSMVALVIESGHLVQRTLTGRDAVSNMIVHFYDHKFDKVRDIDSKLSTSLLYETQSACLLYKTDRHAIFQQIVFLSSRFYLQNGLCISWD